jgi:hypothetical protein
MDSHSKRSTISASTTGSGIRLFLYYDDWGRSVRRTCFGVATAGACAVLLGGLACTAARPANEVWVPDGATIQLQPEITKDGSAQVGFTVSDNVTRDESVTRLRQHFETRGWKSRSNQWLNPRQPTSFDSGWARMPGGVLPTDAQGRILPFRQEYERTGEWEDAREDVIRYSLTTEDRGIRGYAAYTPVAVIRDAQRRFGRPAQ